MAGSQLFGSICIIQAFGLSKKCPKETVTCMKAASFQLGKKFLTLFFFSILRICLFFFALDLVFYRQYCFQHCTIVEP